MAIVPSKLHRGLVVFIALFFSDSLLARFCEGVQASEVSTTKLDVSSSAFQYGGAIPRAFTADGKNCSPPVKWSKPPVGTKSIALICDDPDAPLGTWVHWVVFNVPANINELRESGPDQKMLTGGLRQGINSFGKLGYGGPSPPPGKPHRYFFKVFALDCQLPIDTGATAKQVEQAIEGHKLATGQLIGNYGR